MGDGQAHGTLHPTMSSVPLSFTLKLTPLARLEYRLQSGIYFPSKSPTKVGTLSAVTLGAFYLFCAKERAKSCELCTPVAHVDLATQSAEKG